MFQVLFPQREGATPYSPCLFHGGAQRREAAAGARIAIAKGRNFWQHVVSNTLLKNRWSWLSKFLTPNIYS